MNELCSHVHWPIPDRLKSIFFLYNENTLFYDSGIAYIDTIHFHCAVNDLELVDLEPLNGRKSDNELVDFAPLNGLKSNNQWMNFAAMYIDQYMTDWGQFFFCTMRIHRSMTQVLHILIPIIFIAQSRILNY